MKFTSILTLGVFFIDNALGDTFFDVETDAALKDGAKVVLTCNDVQNTPCFEAGIATTTGMDVTKHTEAMIAAKYVEKYGKERRTLRGGRDDTEEQRKLDDPCKYCPWDSPYICAAYGYCDRRLVKRKIGESDIIQTDSKEANLKEMLDACSVTYSIEEEVCLSTIQCRLTWVV